MPIYEVSKQVDYNEVDFNGNIKIDALAQLLADIATRHAEQLGLWSRDKENKFAWVISKLRVELIKPIKLYQEVKIRTWPGARKSVIYPRYFIIESNSGEVLVKASSIWTVIDVETRRIASPRTYSYDISEELGMPEIIDPKPLDIEVNDSFDRRSIITKYTDIDTNHHVNNSVYLKWVSDILDCSFYEENRFMEINISFRKEIVFNQEILLLSDVKDNTISVLGMTDDTTYFEVLINYERK